MCAVAWTAVASALALAQPVEPSGGANQSCCREVQQLRAEQETLKRQIEELKRQLEQLEARSDALALQASKGSRPNRGVKRPAVEKAYLNLQHAIAAKGLLIADLPPPVQSHNAAIKRALAAGDYPLAMDYVTQLQGVVDQVEVDRSFIEGKLMRLSQRQREVKLDKASAPEAAARFELVTKLFTDGKYEAANRKINEINSLLDEAERQQQSAAERAQNAAKLPPPPD